jgi:hypothetical protein
VAMAPVFAVFGTVVFRFKRSRGLNLRILI